MIVKLIKWLCSKFKCNSSCTYNIENEIFDNNIMDASLSMYDLKLKDIKKVCKILNKRNKSMVPNGSDSTLTSTNSQNVVNKYIRSMSL
tara:strand:+ start:1094 stop:1360 length:267 start_codon:yes stop_codon:yes gene_type:complete